MLVIVVVNRDHNFSSLQGCLSPSSDRKTSLEERGFEVSSATSGALMANSCCQLDYLCN